MNRLILYIHGKGGNAKEAEHYKVLFPEDDVLGLDYQAQNPWETVEEFPVLFEKASKNYDRVILIANSIGAFFTMNALQSEKIEKAFFISPIVDMEKLICDMMQWAEVDETRLRQEKEIETAFGETLSWDYLSYVRANPIHWETPTQILYGRADHLTSYETILEFATKYGAELTVMEEGEHWFHTKEQMCFLDEWMRGLI